MFVRDEAFASRVPAPRLPCRMVLFEGDAHAASHTLPALRLSPPQELPMFSGARVSRSLCSPTIPLPLCPHARCLTGGEKEENVFRSGPLRARPEWGPLLVATAQYHRVVPNSTFEDERVAAARGPTWLSSLHGAHYGDGNVRRR
ncbi:hypothetical protein AURDEDRAFT_160874 [Auricularia subglabra TFB-10046 SS5]|nr:hypothetical protein AURDEDRAFT_160874 [Auricularia subglabra TFB-10046 SS5]